MRTGSDAQLQGEASNGLVIVGFHNAHEVVLTQYAVDPQHLDTRDRYFVLGPPDTFGVVKSMLTSFR